MRETDNEEKVEYIAANTEHEEYISCNAPVETGDNNLRYIIFYLSLTLISAYLTIQKNITKTK